MFFFCRFLITSFGVILKTVSKQSQKNHKNTLLISKHLLLLLNKHCSMVNNENVLEITESLLKVWKCKYMIAHWPTIINVCINVLFCNIFKNLFNIQLFNYWGKIPCCDWPCFPMGCIKMSQNYKLTC